jgi:two-component system, LuxR family, response regulator FixJ
MLRVFGYAVATYSTADSFFQSRDPQRIGCVDVRMPGMDGIELMRELSRRRIALPAIVVSGHADMPMALAAIKAGAEDFIAKPIDDHELVAAINRALARQ